LESTIMTPEEFHRRHAETIETAEDLTKLPASDKRSPFHGAFLAARNLRKRRNERLDAIVCGVIETPAIRAKTTVDAPAEDELERAEYLLSELAKAVAVARHVGLERASIRLAVAEELTQLLADSVKTAKQLRS
jgi:hypothetical protein